RRRRGRRRLLAGRLARVREGPADDDPGRAAARPRVAHATPHHTRRTRMTSRISGVHRLSLDGRRRALRHAARLSPAERRLLAAPLPLDVADSMVENAVGVFPLPLAIALNFRVNDHDRLVPMVVEEPSVVAAASAAALLARAGGGFVAEADRSLMIGQV